MNRFVGARRNRGPETMNDACPFCVKQSQRFARSDGARIVVAALAIPAAFMFCGSGLRGGESGEGTAKRSDGTAVLRERSSLCQSEKQAAKCERPETRLPPLMKIALPMI